MTLTQLRLLIVDDSINDAELITRALMHGGFIPEYKCVATHEELVQALKEPAWEVVITDHSLPDTNSVEVLDLVKAANPDIPVIIVSGHIGEETAVAVMRAGAHDYVMKSNLSRLAPVVKRALADSRLVAENRQAALALKENQSRLVQSEKMASLGQITAGIAHELKNPLAYVMGNLETLNEYMDVFVATLKLHEKLASAGALGAEGATRDILEEIRKFKTLHQYDRLAADLPNLIKETCSGTECIADLIQRIKIFSHHDNKHLPYDLNECIETALKLTSHELKMKCQVHRELGHLPLITCDPARISQVFMNLFINAAQSIPKFGTLTVCSRQSGNLVEASVSDDGEGIMPENMPRLFDSFFTTKPSGQGTGLGLSIVNRIIKDHNGNIKVKSQQGQGTTFTVELPVG